jgi:hypothetical protein
MGQHPDESEVVPHDGGRDGSLIVPDDQLPEDLQPNDDNPLAQPAGDDVPDDVLIEGTGREGSAGDSEGASSNGDDGSSSREASSEADTDDDTDDDTDG